MKKLISVLLVVLMLLGLCACADSQNNGDADAAQQAVVKYQGYWQYDNGEVLQIADEHWFIYDDNGKLAQSGRIKYGDSDATLLNENGSSGGGVVAFDDNGNLVELDNVLMKLDAFPYNDLEENSNKDLFAGKWNHSENDSSIVFDGLGNYSWNKEDGQTEGSYTCTNDRVFFYEKGVNVATATYYDEKLFMDGEGSTYYQMEK